MGDDGVRRGALSLVLVYALCHDDASEARVRSEWGGRAWLVPLRMPTTARQDGHGILMAAPLLAAEHAWHARRFVGFVLYSSADANKCGRALVDEFVRGVEDGWAPAADADVVGFAVMGGAFCYGDPHVANHPNFTAVWDAALTTLDPRLALPFRTFFSNQWVARPALVLAFHAWYASLALPRLEADARTFGPAYDRARTPARRPTPPEMLKAGMADLPLEAAILERLPGAYFQRVQHGLDVRSAFVRDGALVLQAVAPA